MLTRRATLPLPLPYSNPNPKPQGDRRRSRHCFGVNLTLTPTPTLTLTLTLTPTLNLKAIVEDRVGVASASVDRMIARYGTKADLSQLNPKVIYPSC